MFHEEVFDEIICGSNERNVVISKQHIFENYGKFYIYSSSLPDKFYKEEETKISSKRFDVLHHTMCFEIKKDNEISLTKLFQMRFRDANTQHGIVNYINLLS